MRGVFSLRKKIILSILFVFIFFTGAASSYFVISKFPLKTQTVEKIINEYKIEETATFDAIDKIYDAVVVVETFYRNRASSSGTGFVYKKDDKKGYIITNYHVIDGAIKLKLYDKW